MVLTFIAGMIETYVRVNPRFWVFPLGIHRGSLITIATPQDFLILTSRLQCIICHALPRYLHH